MKNLFFLLICIFFAHNTALMAQYDDVYTVMPKATKQSSITNEHNHADGHQCGFSHSYDGSIAPLRQFKNNEEATSIISDICSKMGITEPYPAMPSADVDNAAATTIGGQPYILYNINFIKLVDRRTRTDWGSISVLAHEIGHLYHKHTGYNITDRHQNHKMELEADYFSGKALARMGASLYEAQICMNNISSDDASLTHPGRQERLTAIENGWIAGGGISSSAGSRSGDGRVPDVVERNNIPMPTIWRSNTNSTPSTSGIGQQYPSSTVTTSNTYYYYNAKYYYYDSTTGLYYESNSPQGQNVNLYQQPQVYQQAQYQALPGYQYQPQSQYTAPRQSNTTNTTRQAPSRVYSNTNSTPRVTPAPTQNTSRSTPQPSNRTVRAARKW